jgi:hypothetical protein
VKIKLSFITVNYNGLADTCALIDTLPQRPDMEVVVVDNGSRVDEAQLIAQRYPYVVTIRSKANLGFAGGNNLGIRQAKGQFLFFVNNDTEVRVDDVAGLELLMKRLEENPRIGMACPKIRFAWEPYPIQFAGYTPLSCVTMRNAAIGAGEDDHGQYDTPHPTPYAHGAAMMVRRDALDRVGPMPECYFLYYEELDWSMLFRRAGYDIWYDPCFTIYHKESRTTGQASPLKAYYITRNRLLFARRNTPLSERFLTYAYLIGLVAVRDIVRHALHARVAHVKATLRGIADFLC